MKTPYIVSLCLAFVVGIASSVSVGTPALANGCITHSASADGTQAHPYLIETPLNLTCLTLNPDDYWLSGLYFVQTANIDMTNEAAWTTSAGTYNNQFKGSYDGGGFTITGLHHVRTPANISDTTTGVGLFGELSSSAVVSNVHLVDTSISIVGNGIAQRAGAIAGKSQGVISHSSATGSIVINSAGSINEIGGLVGNTTGGSIRNSSSEVSVTIDAVTRTGSNTRAMWIGGLVGYSSYSVIDSSRATGAVSVDSETYATKIGGLIGYVRASTATNLFSGSAVSVNAVTTASEIGGLAGSLSGATFRDVIVTNSTVVRAPLGIQTGVTNVGAVIGFDDDSRNATPSSIRDIVWNSEIAPAGQAGISVYNAQSVVLDVTGQSSAVLKNYATYSSGEVMDSWSIYDGFEPNWVNVWGICSGSSYPFLRGLTNTSPCVVASNPQVNLTSSALIRGESITLAGTIHSANSEIRVELHSVPVVLATTQSAGNGAFTTSFTIPVSTPTGAHTLVILDVSAGTSTSIPVTISSPPTLAATGIASKHFEVSLLLILSGLLIVGMRKRNASM